MTDTRALVVAFFWGDFTAIAVKRALGVSVSPKRSQAEQLLPNVVLPLEMKRVLALLTMLLLLLVPSVTVEQQPFCSRSTPG